MIPLQIILHYFIYLSIVLKIECRTTFCIRRWCRIMDLFVNLAGYRTTLIYMIPRKTWFLCQNDTDMGTKFAGCVIFTPLMTGGDCAVPAGGRFGGF